MSYEEKESLKNEAKKMMIDGEHWSAIREKNSSKTKRFTKNSKG